MKHDPIMSPRPSPAFVLFRSGGRLDLLNPRFDCWTDEDLAHGSHAHEPRGRSLGSRSRSLSMSPLVLKIRSPEQVLTPREALRELLGSDDDASDGRDPV